MMTAEKFLVSVTIENEMMESRSHFKGTKYTPDIWDLSLLRVVHGRFHHEPVTVTNSWFMPPADESEAWKNA